MWQPQHDIYMVQLNLRTSYVILVSHTGKHINQDTINFIWEQRRNMNQWTIRGQPIVNSYIDRPLEYHYIMVS
jgi:hypothetical protein